jgi:hypothetical protein
VSQQRFDLYLYSETAGRLALADFASAAEMALQAELAQGALDLPPCTTLEEWHAFRAGLNQLLYTRYGVTVDDCVPVDLGDQIDYATVLQHRAHQVAEAERARHAAVPTEPYAAATATPAAIAPAVDMAALSASAAVGNGGEPLVGSRGDATATHPSASRLSPSPAVALPVAPAEQDARALRRLFLELPALSGELRLLNLPEGLPIFQQHQSTLLRLHMAALNVNTMPSLAWAAPDQPLAAEIQARRTAQTMIAQTALDEAWSLLARLQLAGPQQWPQLLDEADRICTNLETGLSLRRTPHLERTEPSL